VGAAELEDTPSRRCGVDRATEDMHRAVGACLVLDLAAVLRLCVGHMPKRVGSGIVSGGCARAGYRLELGLRVVL